MSWPAHFLVGLAGALSHVRYTHEGRRAARQILEDGPGRLSLTSSSTVAGPSSSLPPCRDCGKRDGGEGRERRRSARNPPPATAGASSGGDNSEADGYAPCPVCGGTGKRPVDADLMELPRGMVAAAAQTPELRVRAFQETLPLINNIVASFSSLSGSKSFFGYYDEGYCGGTRVRIGWRAYKPLHDGPNGFDENFQLTNWTLRFAHYIKSITDTFSNRQRRSSPSDRFNTLARALMLPEGEEVEVEMD